LTQIPTATISATLAATTNPAMIAYSTVSSPSSSRANRRRAFMQAHYRDRVDAT